MGVSQSDQGRLHQLREEDILMNQHKLGVTVAVPLTVTGYAHVCVLHHTVDGDHQTWGEGVTGKEGLSPTGAVYFLVLDALKAEFFKCTGMNF